MMRSEIISERFFDSSTIVILLIRSAKRQQTNASFTPFLQHYINILLNLSLFKYTNITFRGIVLGKMTKKGESIFDDKTNCMDCR